MRMDLGGYGSSPVIGCGQLGPILDNMGILLEQADALGLYGDPIYARAKQFYDTNTSFWNPNIILVGGSCDAKLEQANGIMSDLGKLIRGAGSAPNAPDDPVAPDDSTPGYVKWIVIGAVAVGSALVVAQIAPLIGIAVLRHKAKPTHGYRRKRRRR